MKTILLCILSLIFAGCGITYAEYDRETGKASFWLGKEYDDFVLYVEEPGGGKIYIHANHVKAFEGQKENAKAIENLTKGVVKGVTGQ